jgi:hypothetical protein
VKFKANCQLPWVLGEVKLVEQFISFKLPWDCGTEVLNNSDGVSSARWFKSCYLPVQSSLFEWTLTYSYLFVVMMWSSSGGFKKCNLPSPVQPQRVDLDIFTFVIAVMMWSEVLMWQLGCRLIICSHLIWVGKRIGIPHNLSIPSTCTCPGQRFFP